MTEGGFVRTQRTTPESATEKLSSALSRSGHLSEEEKVRKLQLYTQHLDLAKQEHTTYNTQISVCRDNYDPSADIATMHYSYDFTYPNNILQPGPAYFLTARKCQLFGVACEPLGWQVNYLIDEADVVEKGANTTISLLHHFLENWALKGDVVYLHAVNLCWAKQEQCHHPVSDVEGVTR